MTSLFLARRSTLLAAAVVVGGAATALAPRSFAQEARPVPAPAVDEAASGGSTETAVLAGGCFWGVQGVFQHVKGVTSASRVTPAANSRPRITTRSAPAGRAMRNP